jgi:hypothetical protein
VREVSGEGKRAGRGARGAMRGDMMMTMMMTMTTKMTLHAIAASGRQKKNNNQLQMNEDAVVRIDRGR